jgi:predicted transcriptional regulator
MKTLRLTEAGLNELVKRIVEQEKKGGLFMDYHKEGKAKTGKKALSMIKKITDKLSTMKDKFDNSNFAFSEADVKKLESIYDTLSGK